MQDYFSRHWMDRPEKCSRSGCDMGKRARLRASPEGSHEPRGLPPAYTSPPYTADKFPKSGAPPYNRNAKHTVDAKGSLEGSWVSPRSIRTTSIPQRQPSPSENTYPMRFD